MSPEVVIVQVDIKANNERLVELTKQLNENRTALKALSDANKDGRLSNDDLAAGQVRLSQSSKQAQGEIALLTKANAQQDVANKAATGSTEQLRAQYGLAVASLNKLTTEERENTVAGQKLQATTKAMNEELRRQEANYGSTARAVGDYNKGVKDVNVVNGQLNGGLKVVTGALDKFGGTAKALPGPLGAIGSGLVGTASGFITATRAALAFLATPIGLVLGLVAAAVYAVKTAFEGSAEGQGKYAKAMGVIGAVLGNLKDVVILAGEKLISLFERPMESLGKLGTSLKENLINRFVGLFELIPKVGTAIVLLFQGKFAEASKVAANAVGKVALGVDSITDAYGKATDALSAFGAENVREGNLALKVRAQRSEAGKLERQLITERAEGLDKVATLELQARQKEQFSAAQRKGFLLEAGRINDDLFAKEGKVATLRRDAGALEATFAKQTKENLTEQANLAKDVIEANTRAIEARRANQRLLNSLNGELAAATATQRKAAAAAAQKAREDAIKGKQTEVEQELLQVVKGSAAELVLLQRKLDLAAALVLVSDKKTAADRKLLLDTVEVEKEALQDAFNQKAIEAAKKHTAETVAEANREYAAAQKALEDYLNTKRAAVERDRAEGKTSEFEYKKQLNAIEKAGNDAALVNAKDYSRETGAIEKKGAETELARINLLKDEKKRIAEAEITIQQASLQAATITSDLIIDGFGKESAAGQVALAAKKIFALAEVAINLERQLSANALYGSTLGPLGLPYQIATDALAIAGALASAAKIAGFARGGYVSGAGSGTSDSIPARLSNGESVMNANTTSAFGPLLSHLNVLGGGVAFATGGLVPGSPARAVPVADGGLVARQLGGMAPQLDYPTLIKAIADFGNFEITGRQIEKTTARRAFPRAASTLG